MDNARYARLRDGSWGIRLVGRDASRGMWVTVTRRDGSTCDEMIGRIIWHKDDIWLCEIASAPDRERLASRPNTDVPRLTRAACPLPPDDGTVPF